MTDSGKTLIFTENAYNYIRKYKTLDGYNPDETYPGY